MSSSVTPIAKTNGTCKRCGRCCQYFVLDTEAFHNDLEWLKVVHDGVLAESGKRALLPVPCSKLKDGNVCSIYDSRPRFCRDWPGKKEDCDLDWMKDYGCRYFED